jgi:hypothetical protein
MKKLVIAAIGTFAAAILVGCENPGWNQWDSVSLQNNSDQAVILRDVRGGSSPANPVTYVPVATAQPHSVAEAHDIMSRGQCDLRWDVADGSGKQLRTIDKVCGNQTVVYP